MNVPAERPTNYLMANSVLLIGGSLSFVPCGIALILFPRPGDPVLGQILILPLFVWFAIVQYRAVFRRKPRAAGVATRLLFVASAVHAVLAVAAGIGVGSQISVAAGLAVAIVLAALAAYMLLSAMLDLRWWRQISHPYWTSEPGSGSW